MSRVTFLVALSTLASLLVLGACGAAAPTQVPEFEMSQAQPPEAQPVPEAPAQPASEAEAGQKAEAAVVYRTGPEEPGAIASGHLIVKDANIKLLVKDTDIAIDGVMQVVQDVGGYMTSSRIWFQPSGEENYKYASITIGVPAEDFERALRRLRALAIRVLDEASTGEDVTDQYVDLQSQLENLQATRARIMEFLEKAQTVEEALRVNTELAGVEGQIEQVQGRINYLAGRSAFSTITIQMEPDLPEIVPTATPTATPTPTPEPWDPTTTFGDAKDTLVTVWHGIVDVAIWFGVVVLPFAAVIAVLAWLVRTIINRWPKAPPRSGSGGV